MARKKRAMDPVSGRAMIKGQPVENAPEPPDPSFGQVFAGFKSPANESLAGSMKRVGNQAIANVAAAVPPRKRPAPKPLSVVPNPAESMPPDRTRYHRNANVQLAPNTVGNRFFGNVGRAIDPEMGRPLEGESGTVMRKGSPSETFYSGNARSKMRLGMDRVGDTIDATAAKFETKRPAPRAATNSPGGMPQRRTPPAGPTLSDAMNNMPHTPGYEPFPARKKRR